MSADYKRKARSTLANCVYNLEETNFKLQDKLEKLQNQLAKLVEIVGELKGQLKAEKLKSHLFSQLLKSHTTLKVEDLIEEKGGELHVHNYPDGKIPLIVHDYLKGKHKTRQYVLSPPKESKEDKETTPPPQVPTVPPQVPTVCKEQVDDYFTELETTRNYTKGLKGLQQYRRTLLEKSNIQVYTGMAEVHKSRLLDIFKKKYEDKKVETLLCKAFSPLEQRLLRLGKYYNTALEPDEIEMCKKTMVANISTELGVFTPLEFSEQFYHYGLAMFPLEELLGIYLQARNLIYLPLSKNEPDDPFSFYVLTKVEPRKWKLEIRLDELSKMVGQNLIQYGIDLFKQMYLDMFHDNIYRADYSTTSQWAQQDGEQLMLNLLLLAQPKKWCKTLQEAVKQVTTYSTPKDEEKFNFKVDERLNKTQFHKEQDTMEHVVEVVQRLFDGITMEDAQTFVQKRGIVL